MEIISQEDSDQDIIQIKYNIGDSVYFDLYDHKTDKKSSGKGIVLDVLPSCSNNIRYIFYVITNQYDFFQQVLVEQDDVIDRFPVLTVEVMSEIEEPVRWI